MKNSINNFKLSKLELLIAVNGGAVLVLEIIGSRIMAPFFGTSIYVWTAIIGVILLALSIGYWYGGKIADKGASRGRLSFMFLVTAMILALTLSAQPSVLSYLADTDLPLRVSAFIAALAIYAVPATFMGLISPYITKLSIKSLKHSGETVGRLYAAGTVGSIIGTFLSGYWLTGYFTNESINSSVVVVYLLLAVAADSKIIKDKIFWAITVMIILLLVFTASRPQQKSLVYQQDTPYARYQVIDLENKNQTARFLATDRFGFQSGIYLDDPSTPVFNYLKSFLEITEIYNDPKDFLVVGGGAYTLPQILSEKYPQGTVDVVEIDGELEQISKDYFSYDAAPSVNNIIEDGRTFLNKNDKKYDLIFLDAFTANQPPYQLSTIESFEAVSNSLKENGIVAFNIIGSPNGPRAEYTAALSKTFSRVFIDSTTMAYDGYSPDKVQNMLIVGSKGKDLNSYTKDLGAFEAELLPSDLVFTDSYAPTERLIFN